ncbi:MAG TPA: TetR/AcrR family transcriptional regulator [Aeromicrobium sp.]|nr:TetR/AcrR family transcriptional regulator [Aeromicrobium sp.]
MSQTSVKGRAPVKRSGRPRDPGVDDRIFAAVLELLAEGGYADTTIESVARRAGVSRPTIYRRWSSRAELVQAALFGISHSAGMEITGNPERDLGAWVESAARRLSRREVAAALPGLLAESGQSDRGRDLLAVRRDHLRDIIDAGRRNGSIRTGVDADVVFDLLVGALFLRAAAGQRMGRAFRRQVTTLAVAAVAR